MLPGFPKALFGKSGPNIARLFNQTLYTGNSAAQTITDGFDRTSSMLWLKSRNGGGGHGLFDTQRGVSKSLLLQTTAAEGSLSGVTGFASDGFSLGNDAAFNSIGENCIGYSFARGVRFHDAVLYTGNGASSQTVAHGLGVVPGIMFVKARSGTSNWFVYHIFVGSLAYQLLNSGGGSVTSSNAWNNTNPTTLDFTVGISLNQSGVTYVAYLFAYDTQPDAVISAGVYTGNGTTGNAVNLGWEPQWLLTHCSSNGGVWSLHDSARNPSNPRNLDFNLGASNENTSSARAFDFTSTGFAPLTGDLEVNYSGRTYCYMAIRKAA